jgi:putative spermidine/putrescine transport system permease protein
LETPSTLERVDIAEAPATIPAARAIQKWLTDWLPALPLLAIAFGMLVAPAVTLLLQSFAADGGGMTLEHWAKILASRGAQRAIGASIGIGAVCATISLLIGGPLAWLISQMLPARRSIWLAVLNVAANFGGIGLAFAYVASLGTYGMVTLAMKALGLPFTPPSSSTFWGLVLAFEYNNLPLFVLLTIPAMGMLKKEWVEAAQTASATVWQFWRMVGLPILLPFLSAGWLLIFTWTIGLFGLPIALTSEGTVAKIRLLTLEIGFVLRSSFTGPQQAAVLAVILMAIASVSLITYRSILKRALRWF